MAVKPGTITTTTRPVAAPQEPAPQSAPPVAPVHEETAAQAPADQPKQDVLRQYVVSGAPVAPWGNGRKAKAKHGEKARMYAEGEIVDLTNGQARFYVNLSRLSPYIPED